MTNEEWERQKQDVVGKFTKALSRASMPNVFSFCLNNADNVDDGLNDYRSELQKSENTFFERLEKLYPNVTREDEELYEIFSDLIVLHEECYFEIGILCGLALGEDFAQKFKYLNESTLGLNILEWLKSKK